jgi:hypothetical protein
MSVSLFGEGDWENPWHQHHDGQVKEVSKDALDFCQQAVGLYGPFHDQWGYMVDTKVWDALNRYVEWCRDESIDFLSHVDQLCKGDPYYTKLATAKMEGFMAAAEKSIK